jgi:hypothetical protein
MGKPFSKELYADDDDAKYVVIEWLERKGFTAWVNPDQYGIDVLGKYADVDYSFEVEVKHNWDKDEFPFDLVHFSARKLKFATGNAFFTMLNHQRTRMLMTDADALLDSAVVSKDTKYTSGEQFVAVPLRRFMRIRLV